MSGLAGIVYLDGRPVDPDVLTEMLDRIAHRGPDGCGQWVEGAVGLGHQQLHTTPESVGETQPWRDETGELVLVLHGRVDNRAELAAQLEAGGARLRTNTDAELVLRAYQRWGETCPRQLIGDFAFAIWDGRKRQLYCARDPIGSKPFYYAYDGRVFRFGSELQQLFADPTLRREPNEGMIGEYLAGAVTHREETLFREILRLPPAHCLTVGPTGLRMARYWAVDPSRAIRYRDDATYGARFLDVFKEAVRCQLRSHRPPVVLMSGGLDSTAVASVAETLRREGRVLPEGGVETLSQVFPGQAWDEQAYIEDVVRRWDLRSELVVQDETRPGGYLDQAARYWDFPGYPNGGESSPLYPLLRARGSRVALDGIGGDEWLAGSYYQYADLLRAGRLGELLHRARLIAGGLGTKRAASWMLWYGLWPIVKPLAPRGARSTLNRVLGRDVVPAWIDPAFARRIQLDERVRVDWTRQPFPSFAQADVWAAANTGSQVLATEDLEERAAAWFGFEQRHPFHDRRLIEFAVALPEEQRWRPGRTKAVLREAMRGILPESIRQRDTKAEFSVLFVDALEAQGGDRFFDSLGIASQGWVDPSRVRGTYRRLQALYRRGDMQYPALVWPLWSLLGIELWWRTVFGDEVNHQSRVGEVSGQNRI